MEAGLDLDTRWCISLDRVRCLEGEDRGSAEVSRVRGRSYQGESNKGAIQESPRCKRVRGHGEWREVNRRQRPDPAQMCGQ